MPSRDILWYLKEIQSTLEPLSRNPKLEADSIRCFKKRLPDLIFDHPAAAAQGRMNCEV